MRRLVLAAVFGGGVLLAVSVRADLLLKDEGVVVGPIIAINCADGGTPALNCSRTGSTGTLTLP